MVGWPSFVSALCGMNKEQAAEPLAQKWWSSKANAVSREIGRSEITVPFGIIWLSMHFAVTVAIVRFNHEYHWPIQGALYYSMQRALLIAWFNHLKICSPVLSSADVYGITFIFSILLKCSRVLCCQAAVLEVYFLILLCLKFEVGKRENCLIKGQMKKCVWTAGFPGGVPSLWSAHPR